MSVLVAYASRYGSTGRVAERIAGELAGATAFDIGAGSAVNVSSYDIVVIGGPIYAGKILQAIPKFCEAHREALSTVPVALFVSCLYTGEQAAQQLESSFPPWVLSRAFGKYTVGGEVQMAKLSFFHKIIMKGVMKTSEDITAVDESGVRKLISEIQARITG